MKFDLNFLKALGAAFVVYSLIFFIVIRMFQNTNSKKNALISLITGGALILINIIGLLIDYYLYGFSNEYVNARYPFFAFPILSVVYTIVLTLIFFIIGTSSHQKLRNIHAEYKRKEERKIKEEAKHVTIKDEDNYLYLALKYNGDFILKEVVNNDNVTYGGLVVKFPRNEFFHDELIREALSSLKIDYERYESSGVAIEAKNEKKNRKYFVYTIYLNSIPNNLGSLKQISPMVMYQYNLSDINKEILFHLVLNEYFEIEV